MPQSIIFFGSGDYTIPVIEELKDFNLKLVVTTQTAGPFIDYITKNNIHFISTQLKNEEDIKKIKKANPTVGVLASYGAILPGQILDIFPEGILNIHPSLLPKYKGPAPIQETILNGDKTTGVTIIKLDDQVDHGPIIMQEKVNLSGNETTQDLKRALFSIGSFMIGALLTKLEKGETLSETPQEHAHESFTKKIEKKDGMIDLERTPNKKVLNHMIRAYYPWPSVWFKTKINGSDKLIKLFPNDQIQVEGKKIMSFKDFENGYPEGREIIKKLKY